jgi:hypothetical protein
MAGARNMDCAGRGLPTEEGGRGKLMCGWMCDLGLKRGKNEI